MVDAPHILKLIMNRFVLFNKEKHIIIDMVSVRRYLLKESPVSVRIYLHRKVRGLQEKVRE